jgi:hypothetical protein
VNGYAAVVEPKKKTTPKEKIALIMRQFSAPERGVRAAAWRGIEDTMQSHGITWVDVGDWIEHSYSEDEMHQIVEAIRKEERARAPQGNGHIVLPEASEMAEYCHERLGRLRNDWQRDFIADIYAITRRRVGLSLPRLANLAKIYIEIGGRI